MYPTPSLAPHAVTIGREHPNHNYVQLAQGNPLILRGLAANGAEWNRVRTQVREVSISNIPIYQNVRVGAIKGAAFLSSLETLCIVHLGDLSHTLSPEQLQQIGRVDIALVPIGGVYTMGPETAREVLQQLQPKIAIPMHYRNNRSPWTLLSRDSPHDVLRAIHSSSVKRRFPSPQRSLCSDLRDPAVALSF